MIFRCEAYPISTTLKHPRIWGLHHQEGCTDRADAGDFGKTPAAFIGAVQIHQLFLDPLDFRKQTAILITMHSKKLSSKVRQRLVSRYSLQ